MKRQVKYLIIASGIFLLFIVLTLEKTEIYDSDAVVTVISDSPEKIESKEDLMTHIEFKHPDQKIAQEVSDLFKDEYRKSLTDNIDPADGGQ